MNIAITGSTSTIGLKLTQKLESVGHSVIGFGGRNSEIWKLGDEFPSIVKADYLVHLAHDRNMTYKQNIAASKKLTESFSGKIVFLSSFSAHSKALSRYGKSKFAMEEIFTKSNGVALRAGVVYGCDGDGIFAQITSLIKSFTIVPLPYLGNSILYTTHIDDLVDEIMNTMELNLVKPVFAAHSIPISLYELIRQMSIWQKVNKKFLLLPRQPLDYTLRGLVVLFPNFPMLDSLLSLSVAASNEEISQLEISKVSFRPFGLQEFN
jgi:nucleoside-diphosphate-sugar epimerase